MTRQCSHLPNDLTPPVLIAEGCEDCLAMDKEDWVHLRFCQICGRVGCCDNSPGKHATAHHAATGHALLRSFEPGEDWWWCYLDEIGFEIPGGPPAPSYA